MKIYDVAIIGSGPGGYVAGLYASRHKLSVCVIEKDLVGGTCLNKGCIPTKSLLNSAAIITTMKDAFTYGVEVDGSRINFRQAMARKDEVVSRLRAGIETLFKASDIDLVRGTAKLVDRDTIKVDGQYDIKTKNIIIATGSRPMELSNIKYEDIDIVSSDGILNTKTLPASIAIIGGGVVGCEFATLFNAFGTKVTVIELMDRLVPGQSREISKKLELIFKRKGIDVFTSSSVEKITDGNVLNIVISGGRKIEAVRVLVSVGRKPNTEALGIERVGVKTEDGRCVVDEYLRTKVKNIYAIGDCISGPLLAHKASYDGILACDNIMGRARRIDYSNIPNCIWTAPEIASVGLSEDAAKEKYSDLKIAKFPYLASGKAYILGKTEGLVKIIGDSKGAILGVEIFGEGACDLIGEATLAKTIGLNIKDWSRIVHGHPTLSEILQEATHIFCGTGIHSI